MTAKTLREELLRKIGPEGLQRIEQVRVGIAGAGGLGSNCAACLVRSGFRKLVLADFDIVEPSNLDRQFYFTDQIGLKKVEALKANLLRINPDLELVLEPVRLDTTNSSVIFRGCHVVVECLDRAEAKSMLTTALFYSPKLVVSASGLGGVGSSDDIKVHYLKKLVLVGDLHSDIETAPALAPRVCVTAAKQADIVLEYALRTGSRIGP